MGTARMELNGKLTDVVIETSPNCPDIRCVTYFNEKEGCFCQRLFDATELAKLLK